MSKLGRAIDTVAEDEGPEFCGAVAKALPPRKPVHERVHLGGTCTNGVWETCIL